MNCITLTTDFGLADWFVGTMKGVILRINPRAAVVDLTHGIPSGDVRAGAFALAASYRFFPRQTVHVAVVDPGVGSKRKAIAVQTANYFFVGPDNGVFSWALAKEKIRAVRALENPDYLLQPVSRTFHGRDVFAPAAAHLSRGKSIEKLGPAQHEVVRLGWSESRQTPGGIRGEVVYVDRFGNAITNIPAAAIEGFEDGRMSVWLRRKRICRVALFYQAVRVGRAVAVPGSSGFLEIAVNGGNAARRFALRVGSPVAVRCR